MSSTALMQSGRAAQLNRFFDAIVQGKRAVSDARNANLFIGAICSQDDGAKCIERLIASSPAMASLQESLRFDRSPKFLNKKGAEFLAYLTNPALRSLCNGHFLQQILSIIVEPPTLWNAFLAAQVRGTLDQRTTRHFAWLIWQLLSFQSPKPSNLEQVAQDLTKRKTFINSPCLETRVYGQKIKDVISITLTGAGQYENGYKPGGRHDNDFADFRKIAILPTPDELSSTEMPYYRRTNDICEEHPDRRIALHLENQFRLLREDMLGELRADVQNAQSQTKDTRKPVIVKGLSLESINCGVLQRRKALGLSLRLQDDHPRLLGVKPSDRKSYITKCPDLFRHDSFGCLIHRSNVIAFGYIDRNEDQLAQNPPIITLQISPETALARVLIAAKSKGSLKFMQVDTPIFAYQPILECLQAKMELPLVAEFFPDSDRPVPLVQPIPLIEEIRDSEGTDLQSILKTSKTAVLDQPQLKSLISGLSQCVSLIHGPPGTGKSFSGALIAKASIDHTSEKLLVICYTNHALDQFIEDLMDIGLSPDLMVRLGSKIKCSPKTEHLLLSNQQCNYKHSSATWKIVQDLRFRASDLETRIDRLFQSYRQQSTGPTDILGMIKFSETDSPFFDAFSMPIENDGMETAGPGGKAIRSSYLFDRWTVGKDAGIFKIQAMNEYPKIWAMEKSARTSLLEKWKLELLQERARAIQLMVGKYNLIARRLNDLSLEKNRSILGQKRIIACTTTGAAKFAQDLQGASPGIVIVEEAGEILESHILTALSANTKQLVLIGDHKQLRPRVNNYSLTMEYGSGYDLNVSLFERLILSGAPHTTLVKQHRMRPEISSLVRNLTYPDLIDAPGTKNRPPIQGLQNNVVFFNHRHSEFELVRVFERRDLDRKSSRQNLFEAEMVLKCVKYLGQQGYGTEDIIILTPYLGQLSLIRTMLVETNDPVLNDLDTYDLVRAGLLPASTATGSKQAIKLSTIDNYQGEESNIVVVSLTRSNTSGDIGFMAAPERVNVLLSRARNGLIILGNAETFTGSRKGKITWSPLIEQLKGDGSMYDGLPIQCARHPERKCLVQTPADFDTLCPEGGCVEPCGVPLKCGSHKCPQKCHQLKDHSKVNCKAIVKSICPKGHKVTQNCYQKNSLSCNKCGLEAQAQAKRDQRDLDLEIERENNQKRYAQELADLEDEIAHHKGFRLHQVDITARKSSLSQSTRAQVAQRKAGITQAISNQKRNRPQVPSSSGMETVMSKDNVNVSPETSLTTAPQPDEPISDPKEEWESKKEYSGARNDALDKLMAMIGLEGVKEAVLTLKSKINLIVKQGASLNDERFHVAFLGNPGTGKKTVGRLYAQFLSLVGVLPGSHFIEMSGSKFARLGVKGCQQQLDHILLQGGGVLFIDEAYQLGSDNHPGAKQVLDFLLEETEKLTGKIVLILSGSDKQMEGLFAQNPGIPSRVPHKFHFDDSGLANNDLLEAQDFDEGFDQGERAATNCRKLFEGIVGCDDIVSKLERYQNIVSELRSLREDPRQGIPFNFLFRGPLGTGKTMTARRMGKVFYDMGFLSKAEVVECSATDFIGDYVGQTGPKTQNLLENALGKVLFIDEAYRLAGGGSAAEALEELVYSIMRPKYSRRLVLILAGDDKDIEQLMAINPGLTSCFPESITFANLTPESCTDLLIHSLRRKRKLDITCLEQMSPQIRQQLLGCFRTLANLLFWKNGRDIEALVKAIYGNVMKPAIVLAAHSRIPLHLDVIFTALDAMSNEIRNRGEASSDVSIQGGTVQRPMARTPQFDA